MAKKEAWEKDKKCGALNQKTGDRCKRSAMKGSVFCKAHSKNFHNHFRGKPYSQWNHNIFK